MERSKENLICIGSSPWDTNFVQSTKQLMSLVAGDYHVMYVDYAYTLNDLYKYFAGKRKLDIKRIFGISSRTRNDTTEYGTKITVLSLPPTLPVNWINSPTIYNFFNGLNSALIASTIRRYQRKMNFNNPVVVNAWNPILGMSLLGKLRERFTVYYCYDEIAAAYWIRKHGKQLEDKFIPKVKGVIVSSKELQITKSRLNPECYLVQNGVNFKLFNNYYKTSAGSSKPAAYHSYRYIVGYVGTIDDRLDTALLSAVMAGLPDTAFVYIGRTTNEYTYEILQKSPNAFFIGALTADALPSHVAYFDAGIIPFIRNEFTRNIYPMKINEYLAMGKPVISTSFSDLQEFEGICQFCETAADFTKALVTEMTTDTPDKQQQRIAVAADNSWEHRAKAFVKVLRQW